MSNCDLFSSLFSEIKSVNVFFDLVLIFDKFTVFFLCHGHDQSFIRFVENATVRTMFLLSLPAA